MKFDATLKEAGNFVGETKERKSLLTLGVWKLVQANLSDVVCSWSSHPEVIHRRPFDFMRM